MSFQKHATLPKGLTEADLPLWMRRSRRTVPWGGLAALVLCLMILAPVLHLSSVPQNVTAQAHLSYTLELAESLKVNVLYPRWAADLNYGFGSPIFNYVAPLPRFLSALYYLLVQENLVASYQFALISAVLLNGLGLFGFVRARWGNYAGLISAGVFLLTIPAFTHTIHAAGDIPLLLATGTFLLALYALERLAQTANYASLLIASGAICLLWLSDSPLNILLALALAVWIILFRSSGFRSGTATHRLAALILGTALSAFYLVPAWGEQNAVTWHALDPAYAEGTRLSALQLFALSPPPDLNAAVPDISLRLGPVVLILTIFAVAWTLTRAWIVAAPDTKGGPRGDRLQRRLVTVGRAIDNTQWSAAYFLGVGGVAAVASLILSGNQQTPAMPWMNLTTRDLLLISGLSFSIWSGQIGYFVQRSHRRWSAAVSTTLTATAIAAGILFNNAPQARQTSMIPDDIYDWARGSVRGYFATADPDGMLLPRDVEQPAQPVTSLSVSYETGYLNIDKVSRANLPAAVYADVITHTPNTDRLIVNTSTSATITLLTYDYPGWQATINGQMTSIRTDTQGFITIRIPPGRHEVEVSFASTPLRLSAWGISLLTGILLLTFALRQEASSQPKPDTSLTISEREYVIQGATIVSVILVWSAAFSIPYLARPAFIQESPPGTVLTAEHPLPRQLQGGIDLLAYDLVAPSIVGSGERMQMTLYWRAVRPDLPDYQTDIALVDDVGQVLATVQRRHLAHIPTSRWGNWPLLTTYFQDTYNLSVPSELPPGNYRIRVTVGQCSQVNVLPCATTDPLFVRDPRGSSLGTSIILPEVVRVVR